VSLGADRAPGVASGAMLETASGASNAVLLAHARAASASCKRAAGGCRVREGCTKRTLAQAGALPTQKRARSHEERRTRSHSNRPQATPVGHLCPQRPLWDGLTL
jgi:hypothetical protein